MIISFSHGTLLVPLKGTVYERTLRSRTRKTNSDVYSNSSTCSSFNS